MFARHAPQSAAYRPEIDGLRAIAVLAVVLYHSGAKAFSSGYLGVDVFFAISGFLITGVLIGDGGGKGALARFYLRRIRRIVPALVVMCLVALPVACWLMLPEDLENFGQSLLAAALSANNALLYLTSGYFSQETDFKPLFHTWSLGVEEQYYLIVPLLVLAAMRAGGRRACFALLAIGSLASLLCAELLRHADPRANFLLLPSRFWELGLGGMACLAQPRLLAMMAHRSRLRAGLVALGMAMIAAGFVWLDEGYHLPGWETLLPILGTCLVLIMADRSGPGRVLALPPLVGLGLISYSVYLYHVPIYAFVRVASLSEPAPETLLAALPLCLLLAWLSWRFVERPFRTRQTLSDRRVLAICAAGLGLVALSGLVLHLTAGLFAMSGLANGDVSLRRGLTAQYNNRPLAYSDRPFPAGSAKPKVLVLGNSFARDFINMGLETGALHRTNLSYHAVPNCAPLPPHVAALAQQADAVVLGSGVSGEDAACVVEEIRALEAMGVAHVVVIGLKQFGYNNNAVMLLPEDRRYAWRAVPKPDFLAGNKAATRILAARHMVDLFALMDDGSGTVPVFTPQRQFISQDRKHLTPAGARWLGEKVFAQPQFSWLGWKPDQPS